MVIRLEKENDYRTVENLTRDAFWNIYQPGCDEHFILHQFRNDPAFIPELDYVIEEEGELIAHIMYCHVHIQCDDGRKVPAILFGPISVSPDHQGKGYGSALIRFTLKRARELGYSAVVIEGNPAYYHRFGFQSSSCFGVYAPGVSRNEEAAFSMALELDEGYFNGIQGVVVLPAPYHCDPEAVEAFDRQFPPKIKQRRPGQLR